MKAIKKIKNIPILHWGLLSFSVKLSFTGDVSDIEAVRSLQLMK